MECECIAHLIASKQSKKRSEDYSKHSMDSKNGQPAPEASEALLVFLMLNRIWIPHAHRIIAIALHLGVFQGIVIFSRKHYG